MQKSANALNEAGKPLKGSRVLVLGIAYKKNVDEMRESPSVKLIELFQAKGADVYYSDPFFPDFPGMRQYAFQLSSVVLSAASLASFDAEVLATDHDAFDYPLIEAHSQLLIDRAAVSGPRPRLLGPDIDALGSAFLSGVTQVVL